MLFVYFMLNLYSDKPPMTRTVLFVASNQPTNQNSQTCHSLWFCNQWSTHRIWL